MIVEIGTSDFRTKAGIEDGLFIEPVKPYFDRLPYCRKVNIAISNRIGEVHVFYIHPSDVEALDLPNWARGCNSINKPHNTLVNLLFNKVGKDCMKYIRQDTVRVDRIKNVLIEYGVKTFHTLKIDTEGHDTIILNDFLDTVAFRPPTIIFENNSLSNKRDVDAVLKKLHRNGYKKIQNNKTDIIATR